jgi:hypothetical protein
MHMHEQLNQMHTANGTDCLFHKIIYRRETPELVCTVKQYFCNPIDYGFVTVLDFSVLPGPEEAFPLIQQKYTAI